MWLFRHKYLADGTLSRYKARLMANGSTQLGGIDVDETFIPVVKPSTIRIVLSLAASRHWPIHQLDVKNDFLHGNLSETGTNIANLLPYMDDIVLNSFISGCVITYYSLLTSGDCHDRFRFANYFLGNYVTRDSPRMFLPKRKYAGEILERAGMVNCNPSRTPVDTESKLGAIGDAVFNPTLYRNLARSLYYLTFTRPYILYAVQQVCLYMHDPREPHFSALKRILRYVRGTLNYGLRLFSSSTIDLVAYSDSDWAGCRTTRRSTSGYCAFLGNNLLSWSSKHQPMLSHSSAEAEYRGVANVVAETVGSFNISFADIFTKGLPSALFEEFRSSLSVRCASAPTANEC
ncbi:ribonuclease H-like domain-containing protein [Tanacetum coccineum]